MVVQPSQPRVMSVDEWRQLERQSHDIKHEYINGHLYALVRETLAHGSLADNMMVALRAA